MYPGMMPILHAPGVMIPGTIRSDQPRPFPAHLRFHPHHVHHRNSFSDANDKIEIGVDRFENRIGCERGRHKNHRHVAIRFLFRFPNRVEHRNFFVELLSAFSRRHAGHDVRPVLGALPRMERAGAPGDSLNYEARVFINQNRHN